MANKNRIVEKLMLLKHRGQGLLIRLHQMKSDLVDSSGLASLLADKPLQGLAKAALTMKKPPSGSQVQQLGEEAMSSLRPVRAQLKSQLESLVDVMDFYQSLLSTMADCNEDLHLHLVRSPSLTSYYLELVRLYSCMGVMLSRLPQRKLCLCIEISLRSTPATDQSLLPNVAEVRFKQLVEFMWQFDQALLFLYHNLRPFHDTLKVAFLSTSLIYAKQFSSASQWRREEFLQLLSLLPEKAEGHVSTVPCLGYSSGPEMVPLERLEQWIFWGFLYCHSVVNVTQRHSGEFQIWSMLLQSMWVLPIVRHEVLFVHQELAQFFKTLAKSGKMDKAASKKAVEVKALYSTALKSCPAYHHARRTFLSQQLRDYLLILTDCPALLGPRWPQVNKILSLAAAEINWLARHLANPPTRKQDLQLLGPLFDPDLAELLFQVQAVKQLALSRLHLVKAYFTGHALSHDVPELLNALNQHQDLLIPSPEGIRDSLQEALQLATTCLQSDHRPEPWQPDARTQKMLQDVAMDCIRFQMSMASTLGKSGSGLNSTVATLTKLTDDLLTRCLLALDQTEPAACLDGSSWLDMSGDTSAFFLAYPKQFHDFFRITLMTPEKCALVNAFAACASSFEAGCHRLCPEDHKAAQTRAREFEERFVSDVVGRLLEALTHWITHQRRIELAPAAADNLAQKMMIRLQHKVKRSAKQAPLQIDQLIQSCRNSSTLNLDESYGILASLGQCLSRSGSLLLPPAQCHAALVRGIQCHFKSFVSGCLMDPDDCLPSQLEANLGVYLGCLQALERMTSISFAGLTAMLIGWLHQPDREDATPIRAYLNRWLDEVVVTTAELNALCFSETFAEFVVPPGLGDDPDCAPAAVRAQNLVLRLSRIQLEAMASVFGVDAMHQLCDQILCRGVVGNVSRLLSLTLKVQELQSGPPAERLKTQVELLNVSVQMGSYMSVRNLLLKAIEWVVKSKAGFMYSLISRAGKTVQLVEPEQPDWDAFLLPESMRLCGDLIGEEPLDNGEAYLQHLLAHDQDLVSSDQGLSLLMALADALPQAARFPTSIFVSEIWSGGQNAGSGRRLDSVDAHFNNLNCLAVMLAHFFTALFPAPQLHHKMMCLFLARLSDSMRQYSSTPGGANASANKADADIMQNFDSVLWLVVLMVDKSPVMSVNMLTRYFPHPALLLSSARRCHATSRKTLKSLSSLDSRTLSSAKVGKSAFSNTLRDII